MRTHLPRATLACLALLLTLVVPGLSGAKYEIELETRSFVPVPELLSRAEDSHVVIQFQDIPSPERREELRAAGITLLDYVPNYAWTVAVKGGALSALDAWEVRAVFVLTPDDKIARTAIGQTVVRAFVYEDVEDPLVVLSAHGEIIGQDRNAYTLRLRGDLRELASEDGVKYVAGPLPEKIENNDDIRDNINADEVQAAPYGLSGVGLALGMWDNGSASMGHSDYASRLTVGDGASTGSHPTLVCGVMAGDGTRSTAHGGYPFQWRGVAIEADIASYSWPDDVGNMDSEHSHAISNYDIILSQNSWSWGLCDSYCEYYGEYDDWSQNYDKLVRGSQGKKLTVVFSAGNDGDCYGCAGDIPDFPYGTIPGPGSTAKNAIVVGSNDADTDNLSDYSSMGPTLDGRLKPDVAAPGCKSSAGITTTYTSNNYNSNYCGTSFSAPAVSGCVALVQEDYIDKFGGEAWPSTVKAVLIQGAEDQGNPGPDYQFGFGRVNIQSTIDIVRADDGTGDLIKEDTLSPAETWEYNVSVTGGGDLKVTLVWDDYEADYGAPGKTLVNDLDLELEAPGGATYYPWLLDPDHPSWVATTGVDDLNNVEQVEVPAPAPGTWTIRVTASVMPEPNQDFSVVTSFGGSGEDLPPAPPTGLGADPGAGEGEIHVSWNPNSEPDLDHYRLERAMNPGFSGATSFVTANTYFDDSGLTPGELYYYRVFAVDEGAHESGPSNTDSAVAQDLDPSAPTGLAATTGTGEGEIDVSWNANPEPDIHHYRLERDTDPGFGSPTSFTTASTSYADSGLTPGGTYHYRVFAVDEASNESDPSNTDSAVAQDLPPAAPLGLACGPGVSEGTIDVVWDPSPEPDFDFYRLERDTDPGFASPTPFATTSTSFVDSGLMPGGVYYYRVIAVDVNSNESDPSNTCSSVTTDLDPAAPTGLAAVPGVADGEIDVDWDDNTEPDLDHYRVERADNPGFSGADSFTTSGSDHLDAGLIPDQTYYYRVFAVDANAHESDASTAAWAVATNVPPSAPTGLAAVPGASDGEIDLDWFDNPESDLDHYRIERATDVGFSDAVSFTSGVSNYTDSGLILGQTYYYRVFAIDTGGHESYHSITAYAEAPDHAPAPPTGLTAVSGPGEGEIYVSWNTNSEPDIDHYLLERSTSPDFEPGSEPFDTPATSYQDSGLVPGDTYYYRVTAIDANSNTSDPSVVVSAVALDVAPEAPTGLAAAPSGDWDVLVTWDANTEPDLDRYRLERDTTDVFGAGTVSFEAVAESYLDSGLDVGATYYYRLFAIDVPGNESAPSDTVTHLFEGTGVPENLVASVSFVRPNPFTAEATVAYTVPSAGEPVRMSVYDVRGRLVKTLLDLRHTGGAYQAIWDGRDGSGEQVGSGIYFFRVAIGELEEVRKVVLIK